MLLNHRERTIFAEWCKSQANTCGAIADQLDKSIVNVMGNTMAKRERQKQVAFSIVAIELLASREEVSITKNDVGSGDANSSE